MAGHSKWSQIKRQKGTADQKRGAIFSRLGRQITIAARHGSDPTANFQLRVAIEQARAANLPKDNIERAIERASSQSGNAIEQLVLEVYAPEGVALIIEATTDNRNRTISEIKAVLNRFNAKLATVGSVRHLFDQVGLIAVESSSVSLETVELAAIEAGAINLDHLDNNVFIETEANQLSQVYLALKSSGFDITETKLIYKPRALLTVTLETDQKISQMIEQLENFDEVTAVTANLRIEL